MLLHANLAAAAPIIPVFLTVIFLPGSPPPGMRSIHPHKCHGLETGLWGGLRPRDWRAHWRLSVLLTVCVASARVCVLCFVFD